MPKAQSFNAVLYVISMTLAFTTRYADINLGSLFQLTIATIWILIAFIQIYINRFHGQNLKIIKFFLKLYLLPHFIIHLYSFFLIAIGKMSLSSITTNLTVYIPVAMSILAVYLFNEKAVSYTVVAMIGSWILSVFSSLLAKGFAIFPQAIVQGYIDPGAHVGGLTRNYLELHDLVLAAGYFIVYAVFLRFRITAKNISKVLPILIVMLLGMKRVSVLGLAFAVIFNVMFHRAKDKNKAIICKISGLCCFVLCYIFVYIVSEDKIFLDWIDRYGINVMGRNYYYTAIMKYAEFSPFYLGIGRNVTYEIFSGPLAYLKVGGTHSDIIKMFVENGFLLFGFWLWYLLIHMTDVYKKKFGEKSSYLYFGLLIYTFTLYLTDNTENYFICQVISTMLPVSYVLKNAKI